MRIHYMNLLIDHFEDEFISYVQPLLPGVHWDFLQDCAEIIEYNGLSIASSRQLYMNNFLTRSHRLLATKNDASLAERTLKSKKNEN